MDRKLISLMFMFFLLFSAFAFMVAFPNSVSLFTRATEESIPAADQTRVLAWPLNDVKADGATTSKITVIVRNGKTRPLEGKIVTATTTLGSFQETSVTTNKQGTAIFNLASTTPGIAKVEVTIDNRVQVPQGVSVQFVE